MRRRQVLVNIALSVSAGFLVDMPAVAQQPVKIDFSNETVGAEAKSFPAVVGIWRVEPEGAKKVLAMIGQGPYHVPILWVKNYGEGKAMHMSLGHNESVWENKTYQDSLLGGIRWILNLEEGNAKPNPELSAEQEKKAKGDTAGK